MKGRTDARLVRSFKFSDEHHRFQRQILLSLMFPRFYPALVFHAPFGIDPLMQNSITNGRLYCKKGTFSVARQNSLPALFYAFLQGTLAGRNGSELFEFPDKMCFIIKAGTDGYIKQL